MANFCLSTGVQPSEYRGMTALERQAFIAEHNRQTEKSRRKGR